MSPRGWAIFVGLGLAAGIGLGLLYGWVIDPVAYADTEPRSLRADHRAEYLRLIAAAFAETGDLQRARARLEGLGLDDAGQSLAALAQQSAAEGRGAEDVRALADLAAALGAGPGSIALAATPTPTSRPTQTLAPTRTPTHSPTPAPSSSPTRRPSATPTATSTRPASDTGTPAASPTVTRTPTPTATPVALFRLVSREKVCRRGAEPMLQIEVEDARGEPVAGMGITVEWEANSNHFFTGLKPELGLGYADFGMTPGVTYSLRLDRGAETLQDLRVEMCEPSGGEAYPGSWRLVFSSQ